jgi:dTDP-4-dehydrorhamnose 3,5-epimerase
MKVTGFDVAGPLLIEPAVFGDHRGYFFESYNKEQFSKHGIPNEFVQDNQSLSSKGVLRGLHFQNPPFEQGKLIRVIKGAVMDVIVDIRKQSPTFGKSLTMEITEKDHKMLWIPPGFAHGFVTLEDDTIFLYKCTNVYNKQSEGGILWKDPELLINWGIQEPKVSQKDLELPLFKDLISSF